MKSNMSTLSLALLFLLCAVCCGCAPASVEGTNARRTEFRINSMPKVWPGYVADTSREQRNDVHEKINDNWHRDLVVGRGPSLCSDPSK